MANLKAISGMNSSEFLLTILFVMSLIYTIHAIGSHLATIILIWTFNALVNLLQAIFVSIIRKRFHELDKNSFFTYIQRRIQEFRGHARILGVWVLFRCLFTLFTLIVPYVLLKLEKRGGGGEYCKHCMLKVSVCYAGKIYKNKMLKISNKPQGCAPSVLALDSPLVSNIFCPIMNMFTVLYQTDQLCIGINLTEIFTLSTS